MRCSFEIFLWKGGRNRRLLLASQNCYFLCRRDNFGIEATRYVSTHRSYMCLKLLFSALLRYIDMCMKDTDLPIENNMQPILVFQKKLEAKANVESLSLIHI